MLVEAVAFALLLLLPVFAAGLPTPMDRLRRAGKGARGHGPLERAFGFSVYAGHRYVVALAAMAFVLVEVGLLLWGGDLARDWPGRVLLAFVPVVAAVWAFGVMMRLSASCSRPRSSGGRKLIALLLLAAINLVLCYLPRLFAGPGPGPTATARALSLLQVWTGAAMALSPAGSAYVAPALRAVNDAVPLPLLTAGWYVLLGLVFVLLERRLRARRA